MGEYMKYGILVCFMCWISGGFGIIFLLNDRTDIFYLTVGIILSIIAVILCLLISFFIIYQLVETFIITTFHNNFYTELEIRT